MTGQVSMTEIRIHGRGGQGNVVAAYILAQAAFECGKFGQAFPSFGPERRGAPVTAFVRIAAAPVRRHCQVINPAFVILQDQALLHSPGTTGGLLPGGGILINSARPPQTSGMPEDRRIVAIAADNLANEFLGKPLPNTALLAALLALTELIPLNALEKALALRFRDDTLAANVRLVRAAAASVPAGAWKEMAHARGD
jgi:pyruvate ferredoxin oxidoreductase gamma subunit